MKRIKIEINENVLWAVLIIAYFAWMIALALK